MNLDAVATYVDWTPEEDAVLTKAYSEGGIYAARAALPARGASAIYHRTQRLKLVRRRRWTDADDARLRDLWDGGNTVDEVAKALGRTVATTYWRAQHIGLPLGVPEGWEYLSSAARRTGYHGDQLRKILAFAGADIRRALSAPGRPARGKSRKVRVHYIVVPGEVDTAIEAWHATEPVETAARRIGMCGETLKRRLLAAGVEKPKRRGKPRAGHAPFHWRVTQEDIDRALAFVAPKRAHHRGWHGRFAEATERSAA